MRPSILLALVSLLLPLAGCGGHGVSHVFNVQAAVRGKGRATLTIKWPTRSPSRLIPNAANAITVSLAQGTTTVATKTIPRPTGGSTTSSVTLTGLAYGAYTATVQAFPNADGTGTAQAAGSGSMTVTEDTPGALGVALASTVANLAIVSVAPTLAPGATLALTASATDAQGNVVPLSAEGGTETLAWTSDSPAVATVSGTGPTATLTGVAAGTAHVTASLKVNDAGDIVSASSPAVNVAVPKTISVSPASARMTIYYNKLGNYYYQDHASPETITFSATLSGTLAGTEVLWRNELENWYHSGNTFVVHAGNVGPDFTSTRPQSGSRRITVLSGQDRSVQTTVSVSYKCVIL